MNFFSNPKKALFLIFCLFVFLSLSFTNVDKKIIKKTDPELRLKWYQQHVNMKKESLFKNLPWQFIGPTNISGRMTDVAVVHPKGEHYTIYVAGASGGVWKTKNEGTTWKPVFENAPSTSIGDIAIDPQNPDIIWVGTGEANIFRSSMAGCGIYKSIDGGGTWTHLGLTDTNTIARIVINPQNPDIVYVAASGHEWTDNKERGVYKTTDGGKTWNKILYINEKTGAIDLVMDPENPDILYAATWQRKRKKWNDPRNEPDYSGSGIYKTIDGGKNWKPINNGLPKAEFRGRIGIDVCKSKPEVLYAFVDSYTPIGEWEERDDAYGTPSGKRIRGATVYKSINKGKTWKEVSPDNEYMRGLSATYGWVFGQMRVDPNNENRIYVMGLSLNVSDDGGKTFRRLPGMHGDHHGLWIDPDNSDYLVNVNDGGLAISYDRGENWKTFTDNLPLVQFYNAMYDMADPFHVYGSIQDHGSYRGIVDLSSGKENIPPVKWERAPGGEGSSHAIDPTDPNIVYSAGFYGTIMRSNLKTGKTVSIVPEPKNKDEKYRGQWVAPFIISPHNPRIIYHGMNYLFRSLNRGEKWTKISPDLTYDDEKTLGDIPYHTIFTISESPFNFGTIYVGTDDGRVYVTKDSGRTWIEITKGLPHKKWVSRIEASKHEQGTVYMSKNGKRDDDFAAYLWKSADYGKNWKNITNNIPCGPVNVIREDPHNKNVLYVGTDLGIYVSINKGKKWFTLTKNLPTTYVHDLRIHPRENLLIAATHGRGMYVMDISYIQKITDKILKKDYHIYEIKDAKLPSLRWGRWFGGLDAYIYFYTKKSGPVKIKISNDTGTVKTFEINADKGINRIEWDLKPDKSKKQVKSPYVKSGKYNVYIKSQEEALKIK